MDSAMSNQITPQPRGRNLAASATTLLAMIAVASAAATLPVSSSPRGMLPETTARVSENTVMRAVVAAVTGWARDLLGTDTHAVRSHNKNELILVARPTAILRGVERSFLGPDHLLLLGERRLDLPPPLA